MEAFREKLVELCVSLHKDIDLAPEDAATVLAQEGVDILKCLAWLPHPQRAAVEHFTCAAACLAEGRVIPVPNFEVMFPDLDTSQNAQES